MYSTERIVDHGVPVVRLYDDACAVEVLIAPSLGNRACAMKVRGNNILYVPTEDVSQLSGMNGIPFLAPWANRIAGGGFWANGKWYTFNEGLGVLRMHPEHVAIHGVLTASPLWQVTDATADASGAWVTSRLEFWRHPELMANWPFAHEYEMTYRVSGGTLEVTTSVTNLSSEPMPVLIGFHPFYQIPGTPRAQCIAHIPARLAVVVDQRTVATGELTPVTFSDPLPMAGVRLDDGFTDLIRDSEGFATFWLEGGGKRIVTSFGPKYRVGIAWAPDGHDFICFEPMAAITNGVNLAHEGLYAELQALDPGATWSERFRVRGEGF